MTAPTIDLEALKALDQAAAPTPWQAYDANEGTSSSPAWSVCNGAYANPLDHPEDAPAIDITVTYGSQEDAEFIATARTALPALVAEVERLRAELKTAHDALTNARAVASDRIADLNKICRDVMAERDEARAALARLEVVDRDDLFKAVRLAVCDPGAFLPRAQLDGYDSDEYESIPNWGARAVLAALDERGVAPRPVVDATAAL